MLAAAAFADIPWVSAATQCFTPVYAKCAAFVDTPLPPAPTQCFTQVYVIRWQMQRSVGTCANTISEVDVRQIFLTGTDISLLPAQTFFFHVGIRWYTHVHAKSVDRCSIWGHSVGTCASTVFHVGAKLDLLTGVTFGEAPLVPAPSHFFTQVYAKLLTGTAFVDAPLVPWLKQYFTSVQVQYMIVYVKSVDRCRHSFGVFHVIRCTPNAVTGAEFANTLLVPAPTQCFT